MASRQQAGAHRPQAADSGRYLGLYERMLLIRRFEEEMQARFLAGEVHGTIHLCIGQEAVPVGVAAALREGDMVAGTYRGHGHALALGTSPEGLAAELMGRATGVCGGRAGSMNVVDLEHGLIGCYGIVGASIAAATGAALAMRADERVAVAFFGDGATNQAYFFECLNFARVLGLPALFVCENNLYGEFTPMAQVTAGGDICARAAAFDIAAETVDGNDLWEVERAALAATERARERGGPTLLECLTYRHVGHSRSDPGDYRPPEEVAEWKLRDPLDKARKRLVDDLGLDPGEVDAAEERTNAALTAALDAAASAPFPDPARDEALEFKR
jgi:acetoin:2,6-dichlorophenolindophenol oxidoreductase subunit alpha